MYIKDKDIRMRLRKEIGNISCLEDANKPLENSAEEEYTIIYYFHFFFLRKESHCIKVYGSQALYRKIPQASSINAYIIRSSCLNYYLSTLK